MFYADLHVHSKYSRATSRDCDLEHLYFWARKKGIGVVGTGDFTHPAWLAEIRDKLVPAEPGLFRLRDDLARALDERLVAAPIGPTRFMLSVEISNIYKRADKTRKVHNLIYAPDLESAERFATRLERIGNIRSDGRPILGLDSRDLLEIALESGPGCYLVPAHVWTPWFAVLGSKSGFDEVEACYADLAPHVFAIETGLSSDPAMNWRLSQLDRYRLVSNSDAHSPPKLGREATAFDTELDYFAIRSALETGRGFGGTVEFFPEEGKYHLDGHRKCNVCLHPERSIAHEGLCPVCGKPLTLGVLHRIEELADRPDGQRPEGAAPFDCLVPLSEVLAETLGTGVASQKVQVSYERLLGKLGAELHILKHAPLEDIQRSGSALVAEAIARMRAGKVLRTAGYDGEYGVIRMFEPGEIAPRAAGSLFAGTEAAAEKREELNRQDAEDAKLQNAEDAKLQDAEDAKLREQEFENGGATLQLPLASLGVLAVQNSGSEVLQGLDPEQLAAASVTSGPLLIVAGPGTGKTRTLTHRIAHLVRECGVAAGSCLAITFTRRAAEELRERLEALLGAQAREVGVFTFHGLGASILRAHAGRFELPDDFRVASEAERVTLLREALDLSARDAQRLLPQLSRLKRTCAAAAPGSELAQAASAYERHLRARGAVDFDDLLRLPVELLERDAGVAAQLAARYLHVSIDEYQDIDALQYRLVQRMAGQARSLCAIGDPDQAIYGFRGADVEFFVHFERDFTGARCVQLTRNYRSGPTIVAAAMQVIRAGSLVPDRELQAQGGAAIPIALHEAESDLAEAEYIVNRIESLVGGYDFHAIDAGRIESGDGQGLGFADFAVLYRTARQLDALERALSRAGIPFQQRSHARLCDHAWVQALLSALPATASGTVLERVRAAAATLGEVPPDQRLALIELLSPLAERAGTDVDRFASDVSAGAEIDAWDPRATRVALLTLHAAKGLEFPCVFVAGCEDGLLPLRFAPRAAGEPDAAELAEERRLLFVGMTRARQRLVLTRARRRMWLGQVRDCAPSPFLSEIAGELVERTRAGAPRRRPPRRQLDLF